ncbi:MULTISPECIES: Rieske (2Fe-2S) protein [Leptospirillum]|jgi:nitrite reductase/ring-hydroxylating ferredoxin subunit|uniref:Dioxygenase n=3 Tax=Leptospirillum ferriphilum TaxID=178606 RepID=A0A059XW09_9BACT|nr:MULTISPECIES: Rieske 2Fe-2S domain-containing protein [Leptospirillum]AFS54586.1 putative rieske iron-sulfur family protein [Leptospirillum ferriphilum ML-04]AIA31255.1 dioxygenase [Leptospirillum ferriphilum YSK]EAY58140.1 MAG: putative rieske iron-sulfur family protein [Leptospirillum rubarum]EIJ76538.1 MAG: Putative Rieske [2Fe-2S] ferredoxin [Leptospirillum sp. Group II 'C75']
MKRMPLELSVPIPEKGGVSVEVGSRAVAIFKVDGKIRAIDNTCPHRGGPLAEGPLEGSVVRCPLHMWAFDVTTGVSSNRPGVQVGCYEVVEEGGRHFISLPD